MSQINVPLNGLILQDVDCRVMYTIPAPLDISNSPTPSCVPMLQEPQSTIFIESSAAAAWSAQAEQYIPQLSMDELDRLLTHLTPQQLDHLRIHYSDLVTKRDFISCLPTELALHILRFVDDNKTLVAAGRVCRKWNALVQDDGVWKNVCFVRGFVDENADSELFPVLPWLT